MNKKHKTTIGVFALAAIALTGSQMAVNAYQGDHTKQGPNYSEERHQEMTQAFDNNNYDTWKEQMDGRGRAVDVITRENFAQFASAHQKALAGDEEGAQSIRAELGLGNGQGRGDGQGKGMGRHNSDSRGQNKGGHFVDANDDGVCDNMN